MNRNRVIPFIFIFLLTGGCQTENNDSNSEQWTVELMQSSDVKAAGRAEEGIAPECLIAGSSRPIEIGTILSIEPPELGICDGKESLYALAYVPITFQVGDSKRVIDYVGASIDDFQIDQQFLISSAPNQGRFTSFLPPMQIVVGKGSFSGSLVDVEQQANASRANVESICGEASEMTDAERTTAFLKLLQDSNICGTL